MMSDGDPTKVGRRHEMVGRRMERAILPREPQVSVVTRTIYASSTSTTTALAIPTDDPSIPLGPIVGGIVGGMAIVLLAVGGWFWWGSRLRAAKAKDAKARRAQELDQRRRTESSEGLRSASQSKPDLRMSEKSGTRPATEPVKKPSAILSEKPNPTAHHRSPFNHTTVSSTSLASSKYAPSRPSPLALGVITRSSSVMTDAPPIPSLPSLPSVNVVPASPPMPARALLSPTEPDRAQRHSVQSVASEYSTESAVGVAYGGDETDQEVYKHPRDEWLESKQNAVGRVRPLPPMKR
ncbi:hypothetical protein FS749_006590 [Ceratobasidium sp. UAMH 11750]|nr:hypothetical protein FS749_006590 [Ceratobasidium sp. UAMH 11750]